MASDGGDIAGGRARAAVRRSLLAWYRRQARDLPFRGTDDPYRIWLSEVMLQQTRMEVVVPRWLRFTERWPTVADLAAADTDEVLAEWSGLGYYRRARNLHAAARAVATEHDGSFPRDPADLRELPGVGDYTAAAVASIAFGRPVAAVDGNVRRVLARLGDIPGDVTRGDAARAVSDLADALVEDLPPDDARDWNQAVMELGATVCLPRSPRCDACPLERRCAARAAGTVDERPAPRPRRAPRRVDARGAWIERDGGVVVVRRRDRVMDGLWELPGNLPDGCPTGSAPKDALRTSVREAHGLDLEVGEPLATVRHGIAGRDIRLTVHLCRLDGTAAEPAPDRRLLDPAAPDPARALGAGVAGSTLKVLQAVRRR